MKGVLALMLIVASTDAINCPSSWTVYKDVEEGFYNYLTENPNHFTVFRKTFYQCSEDNILQFHTNWSVETSFTENDLYFQVNVDDILVSCVESEHNNVRLVLRVRYRSQAVAIINWYWSDWTKGDYLFLKKNCDKIYWTNWIETTNCETSSHIRFRRSCVDCDGDALEQIYCDAAGDLAVMEQECNHYWSEWVEGSCFANACNLTGERVKTRKCLYGNGSEVLNVKLCSNGTSTMKEQCLENITLQTPCTLGWGEWNNGPCETADCNSTGERIKARHCLYNDRTEASDILLCSNGNETATTRETCTNATFSVDCKHQTSSCLLNITDIYIVIGVTAPLIFILCILLALMYYRLKQAQILLSNNTTLNTTTQYKFAKDKFGNLKSNVTEESHDETKLPRENVDHAAFYAKPTDREKEELQTVNKPLKHQNNEIKPEAKSDGSTNSHQKDVKSQNNVPTTKSNVCDLVINDDSSMCEITTTRHQDEFNYSNSTEPEFTYNSEQDPKMYSNLQSPTDVADCTYSKLNR